MEELGKLLYTIALKYQREVFHQTCIDICSRLKLQHLAPAIHANAPQLNHLHNHITLVSTNLHMTDTYKR